MTTESFPEPILLVEDNPVDIDLTLRAFARKPVHNPIEIARDGEEALARVPRWEHGEPAPRVILLDVKLPGISGLDVLRQLKAHRRFRRIPVVMLTTSADDGDVRCAYELGVNSYVVKPVSFATFVEFADRIGSYWCRLNEVPR